MGKEKSKGPVETPQEKAAKAAARTEAENMAENVRREAADKKALDDAAAKIAQSEQAARDNIVETPLSDDERAELKDLEIRANRGTYQPAPADMLKLGKLRLRAKL